MSDPGDRPSPVAPDARQAVLRHRHRQAVPDQVVAHQPRQIRLVLDHQHSAHALILPTSAAYSNLHGFRDPPVRSDTEGVTGRFPTAKEDACPSAPRP